MSDSSPRGLPERWRVGQARPATLRSSCSAQLVLSGTAAAIRLRGAHRGPLQSSTVHSAGYSVPALPGAKISLGMPARQHRKTHCWSLVPLGPGTASPEQTPPPNVRFLAGERAFLGHSLQGGQKPALVKGGGREAYVVPGWRWFGPGPTSSDGEEPAGPCLGVCLGGHPSRGACRERMGSRRLRELELGQDRKGGGTGL